MKKFAAALLLMFLLLPAGCGGTQPSFSVELTGEASFAEPLSAELCGEAGESLGTARLKRGKNVLPQEGTPYYVVCSVPEEADCPVEYADGSDLSLTVSAAEYAADEGAFLHTYRVFLKNARPEHTYRLELCRLGEDGTPGFCKIAAFRDGAAQLPLADGAYSLKIFADAETVYEETLDFAFASSRRFSVFDLEE